MEFSNVKRIKSNWFNGVINEDGRTAEIQIPSKTWHLNTIKIDQLISELQELKAVMVETKVYEYTVYYQLETGIMLLPSFGVESTMPEILNQVKLYSYARQLVVDNIIKYMNEGKELPELVLMKDIRYNFMDIKVTELDISRALFDIKLYNGGNV